MAMLLCGTLFQAAAQDAQSVMDRYEKSSGFDKVDLQKSNVMTKMKVSAMGMEIPCTVIIAPDRMRTEMKINGQNVLMIVAGDKGWMSMPGMGVQAIPQEQLAQMSGQYDVLSNLKWDRSGFEMTLLEPVRENGKEYQVVRAVPKKGDSSEQQQDLYFDPATGLIAFVQAQADVNGQKATVRTGFTGYKTSGGVQYPSEIKTSMNGNVVSAVTIDSLVIDYPVTDEMFAEPK